MSKKYFTLDELSLPQNSRRTAKADGSTFGVYEDVYESWERGGRGLEYDRENHYRGHGYVPCKLVSTLDHIVSVDAGLLTFLPVENNIPVGQYHRAVGEDDGVRPPWRHYPQIEHCPSNDGGYHCAVIDTRRPGSEWNVAVRVVDLPALIDGDPPLGQRVQCIWLCRDEFRFVSRRGAGPDDRTEECRGLMRSKHKVVLPSGLVRVVDPAFYKIEKGCDTWPTPTVSCGPGDGLYPIEVLYDDKNAGTVGAIRVQCFV